MANLARGPEFDTYALVHTTKVAYNVVSQQYACFRKYTCSGETLHLQINLALPNIEFSLTLNISFHNFLQ